MKSNSAPIAMTIAGSDSGGGAGIQADLKTFSALGVYGATVITALTAQNTKAVTAIEEINPDFIRAQFDAVISDIGTNAVKIGMLGNEAIISAVSDCLTTWRPTNIVVDPVMVAKSGDKLLSTDAIDALRSKLLPKASLITPNLPEACALLDEAPITDVDQMENMARRLLEFGAKAVLLKGGHLHGGESPDILVGEGFIHWLHGTRVATKNTHGTGCTLSAAIAAQLAKGSELPEAVKAGKAYIQNAIANADGINIGTGHGPVHHFYQWWP